MDMHKEKIERCGEICLSNSGIIFFVCSLCDQNCKDYKQFLGHITNAHNLQFSFWDDIHDPVDFDEQKECIDYEELKEDVDVFMKILDDEETISMNVTEVKEEYVEENSKSDKQLIEENNSKNNENSNFKCLYCPKVIKSKGNFDKHILRHSEQNKRYSCGIDGCTKRFFQRFELNQHKRTHTGERPHMCPDCGLRFITGGKLNAHISKVHKSERKKVCNICNKSFFNNYFLRCHMAAHTEERNHMCDICKASFKRRKTLVAHKKLHENKFEYKCNECDAKFNQRPALKGHVKRRHYS